MTDWSTFQKKIYLKKADVYLCYFDTKARSCNQRCSLNNGIFNFFFQNLQENYSAGVSLLIKLQTPKRRYFSPDAFLCRCFPDSNYFKSYSATPFSIIFPNIKWIITLLLMRTPVFDKTFRHTLCWLSRFGNKNLVQL